MGSKMKKLKRKFRNALGNVHPVHTFKKYLLPVTAAVTIAFTPSVAASAKTQSKNTVATVPKTDNKDKTDEKIQNVVNRYAKMISSLLIETGIHPMVVDNFTERFKKAEKNKRLPKEVKKIDRKNVPDALFVLTRMFFYKWGKTKIGQPPKDIQMAFLDLYNKYGGTNYELNPKSIIKLQRDTIKYFNGRSSDSNLELLKSLGPFLADVVANYGHYVKGGYVRKQMEELKKIPINLDENYVKKAIDGLLNEDGMLGYATMLLCSVKVMIDNSNELKEPVFNLINSLTKEVEKISRSRSPIVQQPVKKEEVYKTEKYVNISYTSGMLNLMPITTNSFIGSFYSVSFSPGAASLVGWDKEGADRALSDALNGKDISKYASMTGQTPGEARASVNAFKKSGKVKDILKGTLADSDFKNHLVITNIAYLGSFTGGISLQFGKSVNFGIDAGANIYQITSMSDTKKTKHFFMPIMDTHLMLDISISDSFAIQSYLLFGGNISGLGGKWGLKSSMFGTGSAALLFGQRDKFQFGLYGGYTAINFYKTPFDTRIPTGGLEFLYNKDSIPFTLSLEYNGIKESYGSRLNFVNVGGSVKLLRNRLILFSKIGVDPSDLSTSFSGGLNAYLGKDVNLSITGSVYDLKNSGYDSITGGFYLGLTFSPYIPLGK